MEKLPIHVLQQSVLTWYQSHGRHTLPWRTLESQGIDVPYGVMVSEFMLQQTQVERVVPKYRAFLHYFPTVRKLAEATPALVITLWSGLGYNRRAIHLHAAAKAIVATHDGVVPSTLGELQALPGIGPYTAAAILSFGFNQPCAVVDTNIARFYELLVFGYEKPTPRVLAAFAAQFVPEKQSRDWHAGIMDVISSLRGISSPKLQQEQLVEALHLPASWPFPPLGSAPLTRPKQSRFKHSPRYFRGKVVAYLREQPDHRATLNQVAKHLSSEPMPESLSLEGLLQGIKRSGLITFREPLKARTIIRLP